MNYLAVFSNPIFLKRITWQLKCEYWFEYFFVVFLVYETIEQSTNKCIASTARRRSTSQQPLDVERHLLCAEALSVGCVRLQRLRTDYSISKSELLSLSHSVRLKLIRANNPFLKKVEQDESNSIESTRMRTDFVFSFMFSLSFQNLEEDEVKVDGGGFLRSLTLPRPEPPTPVSPPYGI